MNSDRRARGGRWIGGQQAAAPDFPRVVARLDVMHAVDVENGIGPARQDAVDPDLDQRIQIALRIRHEYRLGRRRRWQRREPANVVRQATVDDDGEFSRGNTGE